MIEIKKGAEPDGLKKLREDPMLKGFSPKEMFAELKNPLKEEVIKSLRREQGQLCVYCMGRIPREDKDPGIAGITIEHYIPVEPKDGRDVGQALDYHNLFAVCHGNVKRRVRGARRVRTKEDLTCDKHRENTEFRKVDPCNKETLETIYYTLDGRIDASDPDVQFDLVHKLNLNCASAPLIEERKSVLDALIDEIGKVDADQLHSYCWQLLRGFMDEGDPKTPYVGILIWYLQTMIRALA